MQLPEGLLISISGIRGLAPEVLTPAVAYQFTRAFAQVSPEGPIIVSRDSRPSGHALVQAVCQALDDEKRQVLFADLVPLPTTQVAVEEAKAAGGIDVTASHNPAEYNGLKMLNAEGTFITQEVLDQILLKLTDAVPDLASGSPQASLNEQARTWHLDRLRRAIPPVTGKRLRVAVDAVNGAGSVIVPQLLKELDCEVIEIATDPMQPFPHRPEPLPANLEWTQAALQGLTYDLCVVVDPDADRLVLIDEHAQLIAEEATIPLIAQELLLAGKRGTIILNLSTSRMTEDIAKQYDAQVVRAAVGERNIVTAMQKTGAFFGAEGGGGIIDPLVHFGRDSLVGIAHIVNLLRRTGKPLSQLVAELPKYYMSKTKVPLSKEFKVEEIYQRVAASFPDAEVNRVDGLRLTWPNRWLHVRPSNTEPIFRIIAEAPSAELLDQLIDPKLFTN